jgi:hypothetical protein
MLLIFFKIFFTVTALFIYGYNLNHILKFHEENNFITILKGIILAGFISLLVNFFLPLNITVNSTISLILFVYFFIIKKKIKWKKCLFNLISISISTFILIIYSNGFEPDMSMYHLPYTYNINNEKIIIGLSNIHFRFGIISILQYINAFNLNLVNDISGVIFTSGIVVSTFFVFLISEFLIEIKKRNTHTVFLILLLISIVSFRFSRYSDFGNDAVGHIFFYLLIYCLIKMENLKTIYQNKSINIIIIFLCMQKVFYMYLLLIPILSFILEYKNKRKYIIDLSSIFAFIYIFLWIIKSIFISGCMVYPVQKTCFKSLEWYEADTKKYPNPKIVSLEGEAWAKNWNKNKTNLEMNRYIENFNWFSTWKSDHLIYLINKISFIIIFVFILAVIKINFYKKKLFLLLNEISALYQSKNFILSLTVSILGLLLWVFKFPIFRYGNGFILSTFILVALPLVNNYQIKKNKMIIIMIIFVSIFYLKNFHRIYLDHETNPNLHKVEKSTFKKINKNDIDFYLHENSCGYSKLLCTHYYESLKNIDIIKKFNYLIISNK